MKEFSLPGNVLSGECMRHFRQGSNLAYAMIIGCFSERLSDFVQVQTGNAKVTSEIVQSSFNRLWLRHAVIADAAGIEAFLFTEARRACVAFMALQQAGKTAPGTGD
ncbi:MAG TPA: hypothetical protein VLD19_18445 [Chitinophagaceae bacterium]|nr:hypothetical protein [Chitinophagaceae bacterium]